MERRKEGEVGAKRQREHEEVSCETLIMKIIYCFLPDIIIKKRFVIVFVRES